VSARYTDGAQGGFGRVEGNFDRFGDNMDNAYNQGEAEGRNNEGW